MGSESLPLVVHAAKKLFHSDTPVYVLLRPGTPVQVDKLIVEETRVYFFLDGCSPASALNLKYEQLEEYGDLIKDIHDRWVVTINWREMKAK